MIITCPHCQTKYQVTYDAIGSAGRKVQCAHCQEAWQQGALTPDEPPPTPQAKQAFQAIEEDGLDEALAAEEKAVAAEVSKRLAKEKAKEAVKNEDDRRQTEAGKVDPAVIRNRQRAFKRRHNAILAEQPLARLRRTARIAGVLALTAVLAIAYFGRVQVVQRYPAMAGAYEAVGLGVNVIGLDFSNVTTLRTLRDGKEVLIVSAQIIGMMPEPAPVPPVVVTLIDSQGHGVYEWSVTPSVRDLMAGERATFDTQLTLPPGDAASVRLSFAGGSSIRESTAQPATEGQGAVEHAPAAEEEHPVAADAEHGAAATTEHATPEHH